MKDKEDVIDDFLLRLRQQSSNDENLKDLKDGEMGDFLSHFAIACKKCGSIKIFVSWEQGCDYGEMTGYSPGQKLFKCLDCGNAYSFWS